MSKLNPFTPNSPAHLGMFIGRSFELGAFDRALTQTKHSNPTHLLLLGERGIGKTSLLNIAQMFAHGEFEWDDQRHNFLSVRLPLDENMHLADFALALKIAIERQINKENPEIAWFKNTWNFVSRFEAAGVAYRKTEPSSNNRQLIQECIYSLVDRVKTLRGPRVVGAKDGLVILLDEADKAASELHLGTFLKTLTETLIAEGQNNILFILTGLPVLRNVLMKSHESSLRLFQELNLQPLSKQETAEVITKGFEESKKVSRVETEIEAAAQESIYLFSEGYPHFVQQIGFSVFEVDKDNKVTDEDVSNGFFRNHGLWR